MLCNLSKHNTTYTIQIQTLSLKYRDFHRVSHTVLKDYGYMAIMDYLDERPDVHRILEFGYGFNATLFERYGRQRDVWGIDDYQGLHYSAPDAVEWERRFNDEVRSRSPNCTFRRGLLGRESKADLPENYFDVICSVSVLEEVPIQTVRDILGHAANSSTAVASLPAHMTLLPIFPPELANMPPRRRRVRFGIS